MKTMKKYAFILFTAIAGLLSQSCQEDIDTSSRYTFTQETVASYLQKHEDYSEYYRIIGEVPISQRSASTVLQLLTARGHYTVFAPTNEAIQEYLDSLKSKGVIDEASWDGFRTETDKDSIQKVIAYNSIIDSGDDADEIGIYSSSFPKDNEEFTKPNLKERRLNVNIDKQSNYYINGVKDNDSIIGGALVDTRNRDIPTINGVVHQVHSVIAPSDQTLTDLLQEFIKQGEDYTGIANLVLSCGLETQLSQHRDPDYEQAILTEALQDVESSEGIGKCQIPDHKDVGFTLFAETDDFWQQQLGINPKEVSQAEMARLVKDWVVAKGFYPNAKDDENYSDPQNALYQFITYHIIPARIPVDKLVIHYYEKGHDWTNTSSRTIPVFEYQTSMGQRRLIKIYESKESNGIFLNRFPNLNNDRSVSNMTDAYHEIDCDDDKQGFLINTAGARNVLNGYIYPITTIGGSGPATLAYDDQTRTNLQRERIRFDVASIFPEFLTNNIRMTLSDSKRSPNQYWGFNCDNDYMINGKNLKYLENLSIEEGTNFCYLPAAGRFTWQNYQADEFNITGNYEMTFKLPPVPVKGTYEIRYAVQNNSQLRGMCQVYFGEHPDRLYAMGIPLDLRLGGNGVSDERGVGQGPNIIGWEDDVKGDDDYNAEIDKKMRNYGFMKGPEYYHTGNLSSPTARATATTTRRIIVRQDMDPDKTYYLKFKSVLEDTSKEFYMDYLEYCAKEVYDNPQTPEDIW